MAAAEAEAEDATWKSSDEVSADRFSDLPAHIVHDIMSLLPTGDATRMSAVSKTFESMWRSFPIIDLDLYLFKSSSHKLRVGNFLNYLSNTIQSRQIETSVEKFRICVRFIHPRHYRLFNKAISYALDKGVNEFHLDMDLRGFYRVPAAIENAKSITNLSLQGCRLNLSGVLLGCPAIENLRIIRCEILTDNVKFSSHVIRTFELQESYGMKGNQINSSTLQVFKFTEFPEDCVIMLSNPETLRFLSVTGAVVTDKWFQDNVSKACLMESLELSRNTMLTDVKLSSANLKSIVFRECTAVNKIEFGSMNLHSFIYAYMQPSKVNVDCFRNLKNLELNYSDSNQVMANAIVSEMPGLERLTLEGCKGLKMVEICHKHLKNLQLKYCINLTFVKIDTPGLVSFTYRGRLLPLHLINCKPLLVDAEFSFWIEAVSVGKLFFDLRNMISQFDHTKSLTLRFSYGEVSSSRILLIICLSFYVSRLIICLIMNFSLLYFR
ncbi:hypothetical protein NMG60_11003034 [Bertholletia excelsa]